MLILGQEQIAEVFGVAPKTIVDWQGQGFPVALRGSPGIPSEYETKACIEWFRDRAVRSVQAEKPQDRLARVQADKIEMENAERRGLLIPADMLEPKLRAAFIAAREMLLESVTRLSRELPSDQASREAVLQEEFESFLNKLADWAHADQEGDEDDA